MTLRLPKLALPLAALALALASCGGDETATNDPNLIASNDYESMVGWQPDPNAVTREHAHSGKYAVVVAPGRDFAGGYGMALGKASTRKPRKLQVEGWGYMTDAKATARLWVQIYDPATGQEVFGDGIDFGSAVKEPKKWTKVTKDISLPETITSTQELRVFLWRVDAETPAYLDDLRIALVE